MSRSVDEVRDLLQHFDPAPPTAPDNPAFRHRLATMPDDVAATPPASTPKVRRPAFAGHRRLTWGVIAAAVLTVAGVAYQSVGDNTPQAVAATPAVIPLEADEPASTRLEQLAVAAEATGGQAPGAGQSWYRRLAGWSLQTAVHSDTESVTTQAHAVTEEWRGIDGRELRREDYVEGVEADAIKQVSPDAMPGAGVPTQDLTGQGRFEVSELAATPADALRLLAGVYSDAPEPYRTFGGFTGLLSSQPLTGSQLAAVYRQLAGFDEIRYRGRVTDRAGRTGDAYSMVTDHHGAPTEVVLIVDPATGRPLGREDTTTGDDPVVSSYTVFLEEAVVASP